MKNLHSRVKGDSTFGVEVSSTHSQERNINAEDR
jgi:hypothetical protein